MRDIPKAVKIRAKEMVAVHLFAKANYKALSVGVGKNAAPLVNQAFTQEYVNSQVGWNKQWRHIKIHLFQFLNKKRLFELLIILNLE